MHNHDTNETFIAMTGRWRAEWNEGRRSSISTSVPTT
jgi:hypothetical protein